MTNRQWETLREYDEIKYEFYEGIAKVTINRLKYAMRLHLKQLLK